MLPGRRVISNTRLVIDFDDEAFMPKRIVPFWRRWFSWRTQPRDDERRVAPRHPCSLVTSCHLIADLEGVPHSVKVRNISASGISLVLDRSIDPQSIVSIQLTNTTRNFTCSLRVRVIYNIEHPSGEWIMGGAFTRRLKEDELQAFLM
jgi:hypothetical protein